MDYTLRYIMEAIDEYLIEAYDKIPVITESELEELYLDFSLVLEDGDEPDNPEYVKKFLSKYNAKHVGQWYDDPSVYKALKRANKTLKDEKSKENPDKEKIKKLTERIDDIKSKNNAMSTYIVTMPNGDKRKIFLDSNRYNSSSEFTNSDTRIKGRDEFSRRLDEVSKKKDKPGQKPLERIKAYAKAGQAYARAIKTLGKSKAHNIYTDKFSKTADNMLKYGDYRKDNGIYIGTKRLYNAGNINPTTLGHSLSHEYGHTKEHSNARKVQAMPDFWSQVNCTQIPKEYRSRFLAAKRRMKNDPSIYNSAELEALKSEIQSAMLNDENSNISGKLRDNERLKSAHQALQEDINKKKREYLKNFNLTSHDKRNAEMYADAVSGHITHSRQHRDDDDHTVGSSIRYKHAPVIDKYKDYLSSGNTHKNKKTVKLYKKRLKRLNDSEKSSKRRSEIERDLSTKPYMKRVVGNSGE